MKKILLIIIVGVLSSEIFAQQYSNLLHKSMTVLSLEDCKRLAKENNYVLRSAKNKIEQAEIQQKETYTGYFPQVSSIVGGMVANKDLIQMDIDLPTELVSSFPANMSLPTGIGMIKHGLMGTVSAIQPVFAGGQIVNGNKLAKVSTEVSRIQLESYEQEVELNTEEYYWQIVSLKEKLKTLKSLEDMLLQLEKDVTVSVNAGVTTRNDLLQVKLKTNEIECQKLKAENSLGLVSQILAQYIGKSGENISVDETISEKDAFALPLHDDHGSMLASTYQYRLLEKNVEASELQRKMKFGENLPSVGIGASYSYNDFMGEGRGVCIVFATVSIPISSWWSGSHAVKRQRLIVDNAREEMNDARQKLIINMNNCWSNVQTSYKQLNVAKESIEQAEENLRLNINYYKAGTSTMSDLLNAQSLYQQSKDKFVDNYIEYRINVIKYQQALGKH